MRSARYLNPHNGSFWQMARGLPAANCCMLQVGKTGSSVGMDIRKAAVKLSISNIKRLRATSLDFATQACSCKFELHNVFMPSIRHKVSLIKHGPSGSLCDAFTSTPDGTRLPLLQSGVLRQHALRLFPLAFSIPARLQSKRSAAAVSIVTLSLCQVWNVCCLLHAFECMPQATHSKQGTGASAQTCSICIVLQAPRSHNSCMCLTVTSKGVCSCIALFILCFNSSCCLLHVQWNLSPLSCSA